MENVKFLAIILVCVLLQVITEYYQGAYLILLYCILGQLVVIKEKLK